MDVITPWFERYESVFAVTGFVQRAPWLTCAAHEGCWVSDDYWVYA